MEDSLTQSYTTSLDQLKKMFSEARDLTAEARKESEVDDDYCNGYQLTAEERRVLQARKQPDTIFNRVRPAVLGTLGVLKQGKTDPRAYPRTPNDEDGADVATKTLQFIADLDNFDNTRIEVSQNYLVQGTGACIIELGEDKQIKTTRIAWEEFFYDPRSRRLDFSDARYMGVAKWSYADDVIARYPNAKTDVDSYVDGAPGWADETFADRPRDAAANWVDQRRRRIMVVEVYHREGANWYRCVFHGGGILEAGLSPYKTVTKSGEKTRCPIEAQSCFIDRENNRYGIVRDMRGPQDEINKRRAKLLHLLNNRQMRVTDLGYQTDADTVRGEAAKPDGIIPFGFEPVPTTDMSVGQFNLLGEAKAEIERMGPNPAVLGRQGESSSGRAQLVRQQAGLTELSVIFGGIENWELRVYRQMWMCAKQWWTAPDYIRVTDDQQASEFIGINQPIMGPPQVVMGPQGMPMIQPTILGYDNALGELDVDITLDTVPDTANLAQEQFETLANLMSNGLQLPPELLLEMSSLPNKRIIIEKLQQRAQVDPMAQKQQEMAMQGTEAELHKTQSETMKNVAQAKKLEADTNLGAFQAGAQMAGAA